MKLRITKRDIQTGVRSDAHRCPIAQALRREGYVGTVLPTTVRLDEPTPTGLTRGGRQYTKVAWANLSREAEKFIEAFDSKERVKPITIILRFGDYA